MKKPIASANQVYFRACQDLRDLLGRIDYVRNVNTVEELTHCKNQDIRLRSIFYIAFYFAPSRNK